jgi:predicted MFS family arabinose efflux permease
MDKRVMWLCIVAGSTVGGLLPEAWGSSAFGLVSLLGSVAGAVVGVWAAARISESL